MGERPSNCLTSNILITPSNLFLQSRLNIPDMPIGNFAAAGPVQAAAPAAAEEPEEDASAQGNGWLEVGKRNKSVVTRTVRVTPSIH